MKFPIFNEHTSTGPYDWNIVPEHKAWQAHVLIGMLAFFQPWIIIIFLMYQFSQFVTKFIDKKNEFNFDDIVDIVEFFIGYGFMAYFH